MKYLSQYCWIFVCVLLCGSSLQAVERMPWTQSEYILYPRFDVLYQHYSKIQSTKKSKHRVANDQFYTPGVSGTYENWTADAQITAANTHHQGFGFDNFRLTGSYQWMDDILDDPLSVSFGLSYIAASKTALHDISSFHHGQNEAEFLCLLWKRKNFL